MDFIFIPTKYWKELDLEEFPIFFEHFKSGVLVTTINQILLLEQIYFPQHLMKIKGFDSNELSYQNLVEMDPQFAKKFKRFHEFIQEKFHFILNDIDSTTFDIDWESYQYIENNILYDDIDSWKILLESPEFPKETDLYIYLGIHDSLDPIFFYDWEIYKDGILHPFHTNNHL